MKTAYLAVALQFELDVYRFLSQKGAKSGEMHEQAVVEFGELKRWRKAACSNRQDFR